MTEHWVSVEDIAKHLGVAKDAVYWVGRRGLLAHNIGRLWKFKISRVNEWVRADGGDPPDEDEGIDLDGRRFHRLYRQRRCPG